MEPQTLATELMKELSLTAKRWFIAFVIMVILEVGTIAGFMWYLSLPIEESEIVTVDNEDGNANYIGDDLTGAIYNGTNNGKENKETGSKK